MSPPASAAGDDDSARRRPVDRNISDLVTAAAQRDPDHPALIDVPTGRTVTWGTLDAAVHAATELLRAGGAGAGARVVVRRPTSPEYCVAVFAVLRAGAVVVPVGTGASERELDGIVEHSGATGVLAEHHDAVARAVSTRHGIALVEPTPPDAVPQAAAEAAVGGGEDLAVLAYTSGTSGAPRGAMLSHRALLANLEQGAALRPAPMTAADRVLLALPLFHSYGFGPGLLQVAHAAATAVLMDRFEAEPALDAVRSHRLTIVVAVPPMYRAWLRLPPERLAEGLSTVRLFTSGAAPLPPEVLAGMRAVTGLDVFEGYGLTETGPVLTSTLVGGTAKPGSVGRPLPGAPAAGVAPVELRLVDIRGGPLPMDEDSDEDFGEDAGGTGVVAARGPNLFSGYWPDGAHGPGELPGLGAGWIRTGDVGFIDQDGDLHLVDRAHDLIIVSGFNVYPREVEVVLLEHPAVADAAAVGVPDERTGEAVRAVVVPVEGAQPAAADIVEHCATRLARFKVPVDVTLTDRLPYSANGKVARRLLREEPP
ncbi:MAG: AMP-binding protein [Pseudonocardiaceae bacterium]|nr:AMP-binding protein [Pseudonocardiaceae bacterium]